MDLAKLVKVWSYDIDGDLAEEIARLSEMDALAVAGRAEHAVEMSARGWMNLCVAAPTRLAPYAPRLLPILERAIAEQDQLVSNSERLGVSVISLIEVANTLELLGQSLSASSLSTIRSWCPRIRLDRNDPQANWYWTSAFASLAYDDLVSSRRYAGVERGDLVPFGAGDHFEFNLQGLLKHLLGAVERRATFADVAPAWDNFLDSLGALWDVKNVSVGTLLMIARIVFSRIGGEPLTRVPVRLHDDIWRRIGVT